MANTLLHKETLDKDDIVNLIENGFLADADGNTIFPVAEQPDFKLNINSQQEQADTEEDPNKS
ncbi:hypothetical protein D3C87_2049920 [compost metagenome]